MRAAGLATAVLTNDLARFHSPDWIASVPFLAAIDVTVDGSLTGQLKPAPGAYRLLVEALDLAPEEVLFIDDQPRNADGAQRFGLPAVRFDVTAPERSYREAAARLRTGAPG